MGSVPKENKFRNLAFLHNRIVKKFLMPIGGWPCEIFQEKTPLISRFFRRFIPIQGIFMISAELNYIRINFSRLNFFLLGHIYITMFLTGVMAVRAVVPNKKLYYNMVYFFFGEFDLEHFKHKGPYYEKISKNVYKLSYYYGIAVVATMMCGMFLYNALPLYHNYNSGVLQYGSRVANATPEFSIYFNYPGFPPEDHFWLVTIMNLYLTYSCSALICIIDLFMSLFVFHMVGHIMILIDNIKNIEMPKSNYNIDGLNAQISVTVELYDEEENEIIHKRLAEYVNHHRFIVRFAADVSDLFGPVLASTYLCHLVGCCILLLECSQLDPDALAQYGPLTIIIFFQLCQISILFEFLGATSERLIDTVYELPWQCMDVRNQRSLCFFLQRVQSPVRVTALGMTDVGVTPMVGILKTTFSLFTFLRSVV